MTKNIYQKTIAIIASIITILTINGCSKKIELSDKISTMVSEELDEEILTLEKANLVTKNEFLKSYPIFPKVEYDKEKIEKVFKNILCDYKYEEGYIFLQNYLNYIEKDNTKEVDYFKNIVQSEESGTKITDIDYEENDIKYTISLSKHRGNYSAFDRICQSKECANNKFEKTYISRINEITSNQRYYRRELIEQQSHCLTLKNYNMISIILNLDYMTYIQNNALNIKDIKFNLTILINNEEYLNKEISESDYAEILLIITKASEENEDYKTFFEKNHNLNGDLKSSLKRAKKK